MAKVELPKHMTAVALKSGTGYYWTLPPWARKPRDGKPCPLRNQALGFDLAVAIERADGLNGALAGWKAGVTLPARHTVAWLFGWYREQARFKRASYKTRRDYARIMDAIIAMPTKTATVGQIDAKAIDGPRADKIVAERTKHGKREGVYAMQTCRRVWYEAIRNAKTTGIRDNPFAKMGMNQRAAKGNTAATREEYDAYRAAAHRIGAGSLAVAAALRFELVQRVRDVFGFDFGDGVEAGMTWAGYVPGVRIAVGQRKQGDDTRSETLPLADDDGSPLYPVLEHELALAMMGPHAEPGGYIVVNELSGQRYTETVLRRWHRYVLEEAGLPASITPTSFRHGGATELGDAGIADIRPISRHKTLGQTATYNKLNDEKARNVAGKRAAFVAGRQESSRNGSQNVLDEKHD